MTRLATLLTQAGSRWDSRTGAVCMPVYLSSTFRHPALGESTGYDYSRTANPTRSVLEEALAEAEGSFAKCFTFASGLAAIDAILRLFKSGDCIVATEDLYGGTFRLFEKIYRPYGIETVFADTSDSKGLIKLFEKRSVAGVFVEAPSNPLLNVTDIAAVAEAARQHGALTIVDNTFMTPCRQRPLELGADIVVYSATKYLGGHDDVVAGSVVTANDELAERIGFHQNAVGAILGASDAWLLLRGLKTLSIRLDRQESNAGHLAEWLAKHPRVNRVYYPGLPDHPGHKVMARQASGFGAMLSIEIDDPKRVPEILSGVRVFTFAESLGGVQSLITYPPAQTHADMDEAIRMRLGINDRLLRLSVGIEAIEDLREDLEAVL